MTAVVKDTQRCSARSSTFVVVVDVEEVEDKVEDKPSEINQPSASASVVSGPRPSSVVAVALSQCRAVTVSQCRVASYLLPPRHGTQRIHALFSATHCTLPSRCSLVRTVHFHFIHRPSLRALQARATQRGRAGHC